MQIMCSHYNTLQQKENIYLYWLMQLFRAEYTCKLLAFSCKEYNYRHYCS